MTSTVGVTLCRCCFGSNKQPVNLRCGHSVCFPCTEELFSFELLTRATKNLDFSPKKPAAVGCEGFSSKEIICIKCPTCEIETNIEIAKGPKSLLPPKEQAPTTGATSTSSGAVEQQAPPVPICSNCKQSNATIECLQCNNALLCDSCSSAIHFIPLFKSHTPTSRNSKAAKAEASPSSPATATSEVPKTCEKHTTEELKVYCQTCNSILCSLCAISHDGHQRTAITEFRDQGLKSLRDNVNLLRKKKGIMEDSKETVESQLVKLKTAHIMTHKKINEEFQKVIAALQKRKTELLQESDNIYSELVRLLEKQDESMDNIVKQVENVEKDVADLLVQNTNSNPFSVVAKKRKLDNLLKRINEKELQLAPCLDTESVNLDLSSLADLLPLIPKQGKAMLAYKSVTLLQGESLNPTNIGSNIQLSNGNLTATRNAKDDWSCIVGTPVLEKGGKHYYWEVKIDTFKTHCDFIIGVVDANTSIAQQGFPGNNKVGNGYGSDGYLYGELHGGPSDSFMEGDVISVLVVFPKNRIIYFKNHQVACQTVLDSSKAYLPAVGLRHPGAKFTVNFDAKPPAIVLAFMR